MDNKIKSKTRLVAIQIVAQHLINNEKIDLIKKDFDKYYKNTVIDDSKKRIVYNSNFLSKLLDYYKLINFKKVSIEVNNVIDFDRFFEKWDTINQAIILMTLSEINCSVVNPGDIISGLVALTDTVLKGISSCVQT